MSFIKVKDVLPKVARMSEEGKAMEAAYVVEMVNGKIGEIFGEKAVGNVKAVKYKDGVLTLGVVSGVWGQEVRMKEKALERFFLTQLPRFLINKILFENMINSD